MALEVLLVSTYELGRQPFGLASPAAWLSEAGASVHCLDLAVEPFREELIRSSDLVAFYVPMHTATRLASRAVKRVRELNPDVHLCFYGLYAPVNETYLRSLGADTILGGEFEEAILELVRSLMDRKRARASLPVVSLERQQFRVPDRSRLPSLKSYAWLNLPDGSRRVVGYTEASRGCKHTCRHCPIVPVYEGRFRIVNRDVVLADIRQQVAAGAQHITFGDPDFFNGPGHAVPLVLAMHREFPDLTYDVTIKIEHLVKHADLLPVLRDTGCVMVTSAVEAVSEKILEIFDKKHSREDLFQVVKHFRENRLNLNPTFVTFTPWTTLEDYRELLETFWDVGLVGSISPIQYAIRLLVPPGSRLLELPDAPHLFRELDQEGLCYRWEHPDPRMDRLFEEVFKMVQDAQRAGEERIAIFRRVWRLAREAAGEPGPVGALPSAFFSPAEPIPYMSESWFC